MTDAVEGMSLSFVLGTRPEIIKLAPVLREARDRDIECTLVHTGQHYSESLDDVFFAELDVPEPDYNLEVGSQSHGRQTGEMLQKLDPILRTESIDVIVVQGDTNSVLAGALGASKQDVAVAHVEAGLRSFDREMPEEINRRLTDHASDYLFAPTETAARHLREENIEEERIVVTGNTIVDAVEQHVSIAAERSDVLTRLELEPGDFFLLTAHRAENTDDPERFSSLLDGVAAVATDHDCEVIYPVHPRARRRLDEFGLSVPEPIRLIEPQNFLDFLLLERDAEIVFTDSGGVQEECCILATPCVTLRDNTERPETVEAGANRVVGVEPPRIREGVKKMLGQPTDWENPFGDGHAAGRILDHLVAKTASIPEKN